MGKLCNIIFYKDCWGSRHVIKKMYDVEHIPNVGEVVVFYDNENYFTVVERVFDFGDNVIHIRVGENNRTYDLASLI